MASSIYPTLTFIIVSFILLFTLNPALSSSEISDEFSEFDDPDSINNNIPQMEVKHQEKKKISHNDLNKNDENSFSNDKKYSSNSNYEDKDESDSKVEVEHNNNNNNLDEEDKNSQDKLDQPTPDEDDFSHYRDDEEFEGFNQNPSISPSSASSNGESQKHPGGASPRGGNEVPKKSSSKKSDGLKIAKVPRHLTSSWDNYFLEIIMLIIVGVYSAAFFVGKARNQRLAQHWFEAHSSLLEANFAMVGDEGGTGSKSMNTGQFKKENENSYTLWSSGRVFVEGLLVELKLLKRQDVVSLMHQSFIKPCNDRIVYTLTLDGAEMAEGGFVFCVAKKKVAAAMLRDYPDLASYAPEKKSLNLQENNGAATKSNYVLLSEIGEATGCVLDGKVQAVLSRFEEQIESIHISDQYVGPKVQSDEGQQNTKIPKAKKVIIVTLNVGRKMAGPKNGFTELVPLFQFVFHLLERVRRVKMSKESRQKSEKNRFKAMETWQKQLHSQRQEAAQARKEEKRRVEKERLMAEEDPEKARKLEDREAKRDAKKKQPKTKMLKVRGM